MKRALIDLSSVVWTCLLAGKDKEQGCTVTSEEGKEVFVNSGDYGYANAINHLTTVMKELSLQPHQMIFVREGANSKSGRQALLSTYKQGRDRIPEQYAAFNAARTELVDAFLSLGAQEVWQDGVEADDVIGYLAQKLKGETWIVSNDKDLAQCIGGNVHLARRGEIDRNPFGPFDVKYIPTYIALVGDPSDKIPGANGFGEKAMEALLVTFGEEGLEALDTLIRTKQLQRLKEDVAELKALQKVIDDASNVYTSYELARLRVERVNTMQKPLQWRVGMCRSRHLCQDQLLRKWAGVVTLVDAVNYQDCLDFLKKHINASPYVSLDIETSTPPESDEWLEMQNKEDKVVDVFGSELTGLSITFGPNLQYTYYLTVDHVQTDGVKNLTVAQVRDLVDAVPRHKVTWVHNGAFELPVLYNTWGQDWKDDPEYRGFLRNVRDTRIASSYVNENRRSGLKGLSKELLGYEQTTYEEVTTKEYVKSHWEAKGRPGRVLGEWSNLGDDMDAAKGYEGISYVKVQHKMNELTAQDVLAYGADDSICTAALANHFVAVMEIEDTFNVFEEVETYPAYLTALAFVQGVDFSLEEMREMEKDDDAAYDKAWSSLAKYLIDIGFEGTVCPVFDEMTPANIKVAYQLLTGEELKTLVRTPSKLAKLLGQMADTAEAEGLDENARRTRLLAAQVESESLDGLNGLVQMYFEKNPQLDLASPKQMKAFLYDHVGIPVRVINDVTKNERIHNEPLADAVYKFKRQRMGKDVILTDDDVALLRGKAKTDDTAIDTALAFDADTLSAEAKQALHDVQVLKKVMTRRSLFYKNYWGIRHWKDGKIHANANQCAAVTRRYSMSNPNLQQLPKKGEGVRFRGFFKPHHRDAVIASIDFTGQELRLAAERSQDANMLACYIGDNLKDIHSITAAGAMNLQWGAAAVKEAYGRWGQGLQEGQDYELFLRLRGLGKSDPMGKKADDLRKDSKNVNFAAQFGGQAVKVAETLIMKVEDAQKFLDARSAMFSDVDKAALRAAEFAEKYGYALTTMGARRHLREAVMSDDKRERSAAARQAWNFEIQSAAGEMTKLAMSRLWRSGALFEYDARFIAPIHDELVTSVHRDHALEFVKIKHECMTANYSTMRVPIMGSISLGPDFANQTECGDWFIEENIRKALSDIFETRESIEAPALLAA